MRTNKRRSHSLKTIKRKKINKRKYKSRKRRSPLSIKKGGGCNCGASSLFSGGSGLPSTNGQDSIGGDKMQPLNTFRNDPNYSTIATRATGGVIPPSAKIMGGKHNKSKRSGSKKIKGGADPSAVTSGIVNGISSTLPSILPGASEFSAGSNQLISPVPYSKYTFENPIPGA
jgi:hypothetical protein